MSRYSSFGGLAAVAASVVLCAPLVMAQGQAKDLPKPDAKALWDHLQNYQKEYKLFPGTQKMYKGSDPHGAWLTTYVNSTAHKALTDAKGGPLPSGSIIVKENFMPDRTLGAVTVMYKVDGYNPQHNDWFWLKRMADGKVEASGKVDACISCHSASTRDYILTPIKR